MTAPTLAGELRLDGARTALRAAAGATLGGSDRWSAQGDLAASWLSSVATRGAWELGATASALQFNGEPAGASGVALARRHLALGAGGLWLGASGGVLGRRRGDVAPVGSVETGGWLRHDRLRASITLAALRTRLDTTVVLVDDQGVVVTTLPREPSHPFVALDATAAAEWRAPVVELGGTAVLRRAPRQDSETLHSVYVTGAWWVLPRAALTASAGDLAADPLRGFPARRVAAVGLRWRLGGAPARAPRGSSLGGATPAAEVVVRGARRVLRVRAPGASRVEVRGDFTGWRAADLARVGDLWEIALSAEPSTVRLTIRLDGGAWRPPANLPSVEDDFGERSGLLVVP
ncbi:hypothetical protein J421_1304 [Gemmatirosa kalamazoonensis]|uniref:AMP-activated protein kinase glycogen-binding domain-containing protein n=1 Tax=Gemmatirosa kalamazoonensis TaxID=861299 RepID=W0RDH4_9BACT|nr:hypothetical protein J421_1304 [Gemmatirosa kalamazoonensis]